MFNECKFLFQTNIWSFFRMNGKRLEQTEKKSYKLQKLHDLNGDLHKHT